MDVPNVDLDLVRALRAMITVLLFLTMYYKVSCIKSIHTDRETVIQGLDPWARHLNRTSNMDNQIIKLYEKRKFAKLLYWYWYY